jgi:hypothetical protein
MVAKLLSNLLIELTKSRTRQSNDSALVESKNGSIVRKWLGYCYIPQRHAPIMNELFKEHLVPYINYHRPCHYAEIKVDEKTGKQRKTYPYKKMITPYEKLKSLDEAKQYLKTGITFEELDITANKETDLEAARKVKKRAKISFKLLQEWHNEIAYGFVDKPFGAARDRPTGRVEKLMDNSVERVGHSFPTLSSFLPTTPQALITNFY